MGASPDIERVFKAALSTNTGDHNTGLKITNIHKEHFTKVIINDAFTQVCSYFIF